jgi:hypothetical protein
MPLASLIKRCPELILKIRYFIAFKRVINLKNPILFSDKINWLSLHSDTSLWPELTDKYAVRRYVKEKCGEIILNECYGLYQSPSEIEYRDLPDSFVLKTTNSCANNIIVKDKSEIDIDKINKRLRKWLKYPYGELTGQTHYAKIKPQIIAEKYLKQDPFSNASLIDYKFLCFFGKPVYILIMSDRIINSHLYKLGIYDVNWNSYPEFIVKNQMTKNYNKPKSFEEMLRNAKLLSSPFPFVRVDFYEINNKPVFGEMTFTPSPDGYTRAFQECLGDLIKIN